MASTNLKKIDFSPAELQQAFEAIGKAVDDSEANFRQAGSNRVEEDLRIMRTVFRARAIVGDIQEQLGPWANAFGFNPHDAEEVKLSWSLTVGKAVGICQGLLAELAPGWQSRGRIGTNAPNTIAALTDALHEINSANLDDSLEPRPTPSLSSANNSRGRGPDAKADEGELPMPKGLSADRLRARESEKSRPS